MRPAFVIWKTLEENVKEDGRKGDSQTSERKIVGNLHLGPRSGKFLVKENKSELDRPERRDIENRTGYDHLQGM